MPVTLSAGYVGAEWTLVFDVDAIHQTWLDNIIYLGKIVIPLLKDMVAI